MHLLLDVLASNNNKMDNRLIVVLKNMPIELLSLLGSLLRVSQMEFCLRSHSCCLNMELRSYIYCLKWSSVQEERKKKEIFILFQLGVLNKN